MRTLFILTGLALLALAWYHDWLHPARWREYVTSPAPLYRWKDAKGQITYGTEVPPGKTAQRVHAEERVSVLPATPVKPVQTESAPAAQDVKNKLLNKTPGEQL